MITRLTIENFKAIKDRVQIDVKPITLLFGPNSAGKSTIFHALLYAREIFERRNLNPDRSLAGGSEVDLGGFRNFVHGRDPSRSIVLRIDLDLDDVELPEYSTIGDFVVSDYEPALVGHRPENIGVEVEVAWSEQFNTPYLRRYSVWIDAEPLASIRAEPGRREISLTDLNVDHPIFYGDANESLLEEALQPFEGTVEQLKGHIAIDRLQDALPSWGTALALVLKPPGSWKYQQVRDDEWISLDPIAPGTGPLVSLLSHLMVGSGEWVRDVLAHLPYLGPVREFPPRNYVPARFHDPARWSNGLAAWDMLSTDEELVKKVSSWLSNEDRLDTGYSLRLHQFQEISTQGPLMMMLRSERAFDNLDTIREELDKLPTQLKLVLVEDRQNLEVQPRDVGAGISQIVPVVTLLLSLPGVALVEQPELHLHPKIQVRLGDLLIDVIHQGAFWHRYFFETHSEHLILRLLRRIRETGNKTVPAGLELSSDDVAVYYIGQCEGQSQALRMDIDKDGEFVQPWPDDFFEIDFYERFSK